MKLKAKMVDAVALQLADGKEAVLVQEGPEWNGLRKFTCIAPPQFDGQSIIAIKGMHIGPLTAVFGAVLGIDEKERWVVLMASPDLSARAYRDESEGGS